MSKTEPFLHQIARTFVDNCREDLIDTCFVLPNKRSGLFLGKYLGDLLKAHSEAALFPRIITINDFVESLSDGVQTSRTELLLVLYRAYIKVMSKHLSSENDNDSKRLIDFNRFVHWGDMLLNDFDDVDRDMVDPEQIFTNVARLKEISSNYLTPEQLEVIRTYWNDDFAPEPARQFWQHISHTGKRNNDDHSKANVARFLKLWQVMKDVYDEYRKMLAAEGLTSPGIAYRQAAERLKRFETDNLRSRRYVFAGFNILSKAERTIFESMQKLGIADYYWDAGSPYFANAANRGATYILSNIADFPSHFEGIGRPVDTYPQVEVISVPSTIGQLQLMPEVMKNLYPVLFDNKADADAKAKATDALVDTAIVLPDENLAMSLLNILPHELSKINVSIGFTLRHLPVAGLLRDIVSLQIRARELRSEQTFFYEDILNIISHPLVRQLHRDECDRLMTKINADHLFNIPYSLFTEPEYEGLQSIFSVVSNGSDPNAVVKYLSNLFEYLIRALRTQSNSEGHNEPDTETIDDDAVDEVVNIDGDDRKSMLGLRYLQSFKDAIDDFGAMQAKYLSDIALEDNTVFRMVERLAGNTKVNYSGEPLEGLQVLGVLEARNLDFSNVVILSMNERIFPRRHTSRSFIPHALRRGYGMTTNDHQDAINAYIFYRLIARAERVTLLYDSRTGGTRSGIVSRYIRQLRYLAPQGTFKMNNRSWRLIPPRLTMGLSIAKTPAIMKRLERFRTDGPGSRNLSAHSINTYINCPMSFYMSAVEGYYLPDELIDYMDESLYGSIIHEVVQTMYEDERGSAEKLEITDALLDRMADKRRIRPYLRRIIRKLYLRVDEDSVSPLTGDAEIYEDIMSDVISRMFQREKEMIDEMKLPLWFVCGEQPCNVRLPIGNHTINFTFRIDRIDRFVDPINGETVRLIDYKTGRDVITASNINALFNPSSSNSNRPKAILQLMLYANAYAALNNYDGPIQPMIYQLQRIAVDKLSPLKIEKRQISDYRTINDAFIERMSALLDEIFDPNIPFTPRPDRKICSYCNFGQVCPGCIAPKV